MPVCDLIEILHSSARTSNGSNLDNPVDCSFYNSAILFIKVTSVSGTSPNLAVFLKTASPDLTTGYTLGSAGPVNTAGTYFITVPLLYGKKLFLDWVITGSSPSFTFSCSLAMRS